MRKRHVDFNWKTAFVLVSHYTERFRKTNIVPLGPVNVISGIALKSF